MKSILNLSVPALLLFAAPAFALEVECTQGALKEILAAQTSPVESLTITGWIDARDLYLLPTLTELRSLDLKGSEITAFTGHATVNGRNRFVTSGANSIPSSLFAGSLIESISLPDGLTEIGNSAFTASALKAIDPGKSLEKIGEMAFAGCAALESITLPASVRQLGENAFRGCTALREADMSQCAITTLPAGTFSLTTALESVSLPKNLQAIGDEAFMGSGLAKTPEFGSEVILGKFVFADMRNLKETDLPDGERLPEGTYFGDSGLRTVTGSPSEIGANALALVNPETSLDFGKTVSIGSFALSGNNSPQLILGQNVSRIDSYAFLDMKNLNSIDACALGSSVPSVAADTFAGITPSDIILYVVTDSDKEQWKAVPGWSDFDIRAVKSADLIITVTDHTPSVHFDGTVLKVTASKVIDRIDAYSQSGDLLISAVPGDSVFEAETNGIDSAIWIVSIQCGDSVYVNKYIR